MGLMWHVFSTLRRKFSGMSSYPEFNLNLSQLWICSGIHQAITAGGLWEFVNVGDEGGAGDSHMWPRGEPS